MHDRMPVIVPPEDYVAWLDPDLHDPEQLQGLLRPYPADLMAATRVNNARNDDPQCVEPAT